MNSLKRVIASTLVTAISLMFFIVFPHAETVDTNSSGSSAEQETSQILPPSSEHTNSSAVQETLSAQSSCPTSSAILSATSEESIKSKTSSSVQTAANNQANSSQLSSSLTSSAKEALKSSSTASSIRAIRRAALSDTAISPQTITDGLGVAASFSVFARKFTLNCDMEGNLAVETFAATAGNIGNSMNIYTPTQGNPLTFDLKISISGIAKKNYQVGIYTDAAAKNLFQKVSLTADSEGKATKTISGLDSKTVYYVYLLDNSGNPIFGSGSSQQGITGGGSVIYSSNDNYIQTLTDPDNGPKLPIGWEICRRIQSGSTIIPQSITFGGRYLLYNKHAANIVYQTSGDGTYTLYDPSKKQNVIDTIGGGTENAVFIKNEFPFDFDDVFASLSSLSTTLAGAQDSGTMRVINVAPSGNGSNALRDALLKALRVHDENYLANTGISLNNGQYLVVNVNCGRNTSVTIPYCRIGNVTIDTDGGWNEIASRIIWNFYGEGSSLTVNAPFGALGTILAPSATVKYGSTMVGAIYADTVYNNTGEIHKMIFRPTQKVTRSVSFTDQCTPAVTLPETGGPGAGIFYLTGGGIVFVAAEIIVFLLNGKLSPKTKMRASSPK
ncbi:MAG: hypothetical protein ACFWUD_00270 [Thermocaproicibacter melissae]|uniref:hypothetical protein n=1 Tax=Thermocaproicibacter melissae TaxID=2966552 RepID=UPI0024B0BA56|nr:hypothetical protein [Thermocaproicibacter melissae]WBY65001.1 hypothetical protein NOG13_04745 [Thermocaproicibacter melissae]